MEEIKRGDIFISDLVGVGSMQVGKRPVVVSLITKQINLAGL
jgi:mRNA-degrading endonuclease toxin of MazEF toxin-antitoxin module